MFFWDVLITLRLIVVKLYYLLQNDFDLTTNDTPIPRRSVGSKETSKVMVTDRRIRCKERCHNF